jgi:hypothetical protein
MPDKTPLARAHEAIDDAVHEGYSDGVSGTGHRHDAAKEAHAALEEAVNDAVIGAVNECPACGRLDEKGAPDAS